MACSFLLPRHKNLYGLPEILYPRDFDKTSPRHPTVLSSHSTHIQYGPLGDAGPYVLTIT